VPKIIINDTIKFLSYSKISILIILNRNSFRVLFDKVDSVYFFEKYINILALQTASPESRHCANCIGTPSFPMVGKRIKEGWGGHGGALKPPGV